MPATTVIVPCYNEAKRLPADDFRRFAESHEDVRFLFVNDGSTDDTERVLQELAAARPERFSVLSLEKNVGKAEAVRQGFLEAFKSQPKYIGFWDADLATPLEDITVFQRLLEERPGIEMVFGSRVNLLGRTVERKMLRHYIGRVFATIADTVIRVPIYDTQCGAKLFRVSESVEALFREPFISKWIFDVEIIARLVQSRRNGSLPPAREVIYEHPLDVWRDVAGSKIRQRDFIVATSDLLRIYWRYMRR